MLRYALIGLSACGLLAAGAGIAVYQRSTAQPATHDRAFYMAHPDAAKAKLKDCNAHPKQHPFPDVECGDAEDAAGKRSIENFINTRPPGERL
jgi:hypothetical protein